MKKSININISGVIFHIDEDAYEKLRSYMDSVSLYFEDKKGGKEVIQDIETRIAELLQDRLSEQKEVITISDVEEVIEIMGDPSDFVEEAGEDSEPKSSKTFFKKGKRLYRDPENSVLGGVCGGLGSYFGIDPVIIRIIFIVLLFAGYGVWGLVYLVLWIAIPKAKTVAQKLEMKGEHVTVSNIEKKVQEEYEGVKKNFEKIKRSKGYKESTNVLNEIFTVLGKIILIFLKVVLVIIGVGFIFAGFAVLMSFLGVFFFRSPVFSIDTIEGVFFPLNHYLHAFADPLPSFVLLLSLFFVIVIPLVALIYGGVKLIFNFRAKDRGIGIAALTIWIVSLVMLFTFGLFEVRKYVSDANLTEKHVLDETQYETIYLDIDDSVKLPSQNTFVSFTSPFGGFLIDKEKNRILGRPQLAIRRSRNNNVELTVYRYAKGPTKWDAEIHAENIIYNWSHQDSTFVFSPIFKIPENQRWNFSNLNLTLRIPEEKSVYIGDDMSRILTSANTAERMSAGELTGEKWSMTTRGLKLYEAD